MKQLKTPGMEKQYPAVISKKLIFRSWIVVFLVKLLFAYLYCQLIFTQRPERKIGSISYASGDYNSYIGAMENYVQKGDYYFINQLGDTVRAGRPPHFTIPYWLARQVTGRPQAADFLTIVNVTLDSIAIICLALMVAALTAFPRLAYFTALVLGMISTYVSNWTFITLPDGAAAALFMIGIFHYWKAYRSSQKTSIHIFWASVFFSWSIVLRPFLVVVILLFALIFLIRKKRIYPILPRLAVISLFPLLLFALPWAIRNYNMTGKIIPFQQDVYAGYGYRPTELQMRKLMTAMGEDGSTFWDPTAIASYFSPERYKTSVYHYPGYVIKDTMFMRELEKFRNDYISTFSTRTKEEESKMVAWTADLRSTYIKKYKLRYYLINPLKRTLKFWGHSGSYYISVENRKNLILVADKYLQSILYYLVLILGTIGLLKLGRKNEIGWILVLPLIISTLMLPFIFGFMEPRYAIAFYYPCLLGLLIFMEPLGKWFAGRKKEISAEEIRMRNKNQVGT